MELTREQQQQFAFNAGQVTLCADLLCGVDFEDLKESYNKRDFFLDNGQNLCHIQDLDTAHKQLGELSDMLGDAMENGDEYEKSFKYGCLHLLSKAEMILNEVVEVFGDEYDKLIADKDVYVEHVHKS